MKILLTGVAGFIGAATTARLLAQGHEVIGLDNLNNYYDVSLKEARLAQLTPHTSFRFVRADIADHAAIAGIFSAEKPQRVVHLAAQAGVRYSLQNPTAYASTNLMGFVNVLEGCRHFQVEHLIYASSSSVYGGNTKMPFSEHDSVDHPVSLYAATKKANELMAHSYSHLYGLPTTGLRFFTVYGPWGRPDMAPMLFANAIAEDRPIKVFNHGDMIRDFTYVDDIVDGVIGVLDKMPASNAGYDRTHPDPATSWAPYRVYNIGGGSPVRLSDFIFELERNFGRVAQKEFLPMQPGDVQATQADTHLLEAITGTRPRTDFKAGIAKFVAWYKDYYKAN